MGLFDFLKPKPPKVDHDIILGSMYTLTVDWANAPFKPIQHLIDRPLRFEYLTAFSAMITCECYLFACKDFKHKTPETTSVIVFIQNMVDLLKDDVEDSSLFLQNNMIEYRQLFTDGMIRQNMHELCSAFTYDYTQLDGLDEQINHLNETIQHQCTLITQSIAGLL